MKFYTTKSIYFIISWILLQKVTSQLHRTTQVPVIQIEDAGSDVELDCIIGDAFERYIHWIKVQNNNQQIHLADGIFVENSRFSLKYNDTTATYTLMMSKFQESDEAIYKCILTLPMEEHILSQIQLRARKSPEIYSISVPYHGKIGELITLECHARGYPEPEIFWKREGNLTFSNGAIISKGELIILRAEKSDEGMYECRADNGVGQPAFGNLTIRIQ